MRALTYFHGEGELTRERLHAPVTQFLEELLHCSDGATEQHLEVCARRLVAGLPAEVGGLRILYQRTSCTPPRLLAAREEGTAAAKLWLVDSECFSEIARNGSTLPGDPVLAGQQDAKVAFVDFGGVLKAWPASPAHLLGAETTVKVDAPPSPPPVDELVGSLLDGKYHVLKCLGRGGFGSVYEARDVQIDQRVAIKVLDSSAGDPREWQALREEARRVTRLSHPNIVEWKTLVERADGTPYFVMELIEGRELDRIIADEAPLAPERVCRILLQILSALRAAHDPHRGGGLLHLDLKPRNVFVVADPDAPGGERIKVIDFGVAQYVGGESPIGSGSSGPGGGVGLTTIRLDSVVADEAVHQTLSAPRLRACTPEYAAPEHCAHLLADCEPVALDGRADLYSVGVIGFAMLTGELPLRASSRMDLLRDKQVARAPAVRSLIARVPKVLDRFIGRCLEPERDDRYSGTDEAYLALERISRSPLVRRLLAASAAVAVSSAAAVWWLWPDGTPAFDAVVQLEASTVPLAGSRLALGPSRTEVRLMPQRSALEFAGRTSRVLDADSAAGRELPGFGVRWLDDGSLRLYAEPSSVRAQGTARIDLLGPGDDSVQSGSFGLVWIPAGAVTIAEAGVPLAGDRRIGVPGLRFEADVDAVPEDVASVWLEVAGARFPGALDRVDTERRQRFAWRLENLPLQPGPNGVRVVALDAAASEHRTEARVDIAQGPLTIEVLALDAAFFAGRYSIRPQTNPAMRATFSRRADLRWEVIDDAGRVLASGERTSVLSLEDVVVNLSMLADQRTYSGSLRIAADESRYVLHAASHARDGLAEAELSFDYWDALPRVGVSMVDPATAQGIELTPTQTHHRNDPRVHLRVVRSSDVPTRGIVRVVGPTPRADVVESGELVLVDALRTATDVAFNLREDGIYRLETQVWHADANGPVDDAMLAGTIVLDRTPPLVRIVLAEEDRLLDHEKAPTCKVELVDSFASAVPAMLSWELFEAVDLEFPIASGRIVERATPAEPVELVVPTPWGELRRKPAAIDGTYRLVIVGRDLAGNDTEPASMDFEVALQGPTLEVIHPPTGADWVRSPSGDIELRVLARDPNGVSGVQGEVVLGETRRDVRLTQDPLTPAVWTGAIRPRGEWSEIDVRLQIAATDRFGKRSEIGATQRLGDLRRALPARLEFAQGLTCMHLVRGNDAAGYEFGGRVDELEEELFREWGFGTYNPLSVPRSWRVSIPKGSARSFYLDVSEVTVGQYLGFLDWHDTYAGSEHVCLGGLSRDRREELRKRWLAASPATPAFGVRWSEAAEYASWAGKRLPSLVEWEFAVRGGSQYRPASTAATGLWGTTTEDVTPDSRLEALCSGVAEWSASPVLPGAESVPEQLAAASDLGSLLAPWLVDDWTAADRFWVAGAASGDPRSDFSILDRRDRDWSGEHVGFRCAVSANEAAARLEDPEDPWAIRGVDLP